MVRNTSSRDGRSTPVVAKKCPKRGSSITRVSARWAKLYISAVLPFLGPAQRATVRADISSRGLAFQAQDEHRPQPPHGQVKGDVQDHQPRGLARKHEGVHGPSQQSKSAEDPA